MNTDRKMVRRIKEFRKRNSLSTSERRKMREEQEDTREKRIKHTRDSKLKQN